MFALVVVAALACATQADPVDAPPPPPPPSDVTSPPPSDVTPPPPSTTPATTTTAPPAPPPPATTAPPPTTTKAPKPDAKSVSAQSQLGPWTIAVVQLVTGVGALCVGLGFSLLPCYLLPLIPVVGGYLSDVVGVFVVGGTVGAADGIVGDAFGMQRSALVWPVAAGVGVMTAFMATQFVIAEVAIANGIPQTLANADARTRARAIPYFEATAISFLVGGVLVIVTPPAFYAFGAVDKKPGDTGQGLPGLFSPADPTAPQLSRVTSSRGTARVAMAY